MPVTAECNDGSRAVRVAAAVIRDGAGRILLTQRAQGTHLGGLWEFPGGKVERGEKLQQALQRELHEELGIAVLEATPLITVSHRYPEKTVTLHVFDVSRFTGTPRGVEHQPLTWRGPGELGELPLPAADEAIVTAVLLSPELRVFGWHAGRLPVRRKWARATGRATAGRSQSCSCTQVESAHRVARSHRLVASGHGSVRVAGVIARSRRELERAHSRGARFGVLLPSGCGRRSPPRSQVLLARMTSAVNMPVYLHHRDDAGAGPRLRARGFHGTWVDAGVQRNGRDADRRPRVRASSTAVRNRRRH